MTGPFARLLDFLDRHGRAAMVTVVTASGSTPREAGARLVVAPDGSFSGTIGGGALEWQAIAQAQAALAAEIARPFQVRSMALGPELGQCCGGRVELAIEVVTADRRAEFVELAQRTQAGAFATRGTVAADGTLRRAVTGGDAGVPVGGALWRDGVLTEHFGTVARPLYLFGAGHVGRALALALAPLPFAVTWIDARPEAFPAAVPGNVRCVRPDDPLAELAGAPAGTFVLVMTHSHALDLAIVTAALGDDRFAYVGLIGSATKRERFRRQMLAAGVAAAAIDRLVCPIGIDGIDGKAPAVIAAATVAELLIRDQQVRALANNGSMAGTRMGNGGG